MPTKAQQHKRREGLQENNAIVRHDQYRNTSKKDNAGKSWKQDTDKEDQTMSILVRSCMLVYNGYCD